jgi:hypothetical protein
MQNAAKEIIESIETYTMAASLGNQSVDGSSQTDAPNDASSLTPIIDNKRYISAEKALTLRQDASIYATPLAYISRNTEVIRLSEIGEWTEVLYDNIQ